MQLRWLLLGLVASLSVGIVGLLLRRYLLNYAIGDILAITGLMLFSTTVVSLLLARLGFAVKRCVSRSRWADLLGVTTLGRLPRDTRLLPPGTVVCVVPPSPSLPVFCPDNSGDMLTIFEDYAQFPPQPRRLFDTHRLSPTGPEAGPMPDLVPRGAGAMVCLPDTHEPVLYIVNANGSFVPLTSEPRFLLPSDEVPYLDPPPPYSLACADPPPPYTDDCAPMLPD